MKLLFDCDGTLIDSMGVWMESMHEMIRQSVYAKNNITEEELQVIDDLSYDESASYIWGTLVKVMSEEEITAHFDRLLEEGYKKTIPAKDGAIEIIKNLHKEGFEMAVATSNSYYLVEMVLKRLGIFDCFKDFFTPDRTGYKKNQVEFWEKASQQLDSTPENLILFDDALYALRSANDAGIRTVGIKDFPYNEDEWEDICKEADFVVDGVSEINLKISEINLKSSC